MALRTSGGKSHVGKQTTLRARIGLPPMAYTSESALVAAIWPYRYGSSTSGGKKSMVSIMARSSDTLYTAASSKLPKPAIKSGGALAAGSPASSLASSAAPSLAAQPPALTLAVNRRSSESVTSMFSPFPANIVKDLNQLSFDGIQTGVERIHIRSAL